MNWLCCIRKIHSTLQEDTTMKKTAQLSDRQKSTSTTRADKFLNLFSLMNLIFALGLLLLLSKSAGAFSHPAASELHLRLHDNAVFSIRIDNQEYPHISNRHVISNLKPGRYHLQVVKYKVVHHGFAVSYQFPQVVFSGPVNIRGRSRITAMIDHRGRYRVESTRPLQHAPVVQPVAHTAPGYGSALPLMTPHAFAMLQNTMANTNFDNARLSVAQQAIGSGFVTAEQVYLLMGMLTFESNRLKLAQFAYRNTIDKHNYFIVHNAFSFNSSKNRLNTYIAQNF